MDCPMTPDHTLDIPNKRWQGLMNAWRRALHKFDPPDLHLRQPSQDTITLAPRPCATEEDKAQEEIAQAKAAGLQVAFGSMNVGKEAGMFSFGVAAEENVASSSAMMNGALDELTGGASSAAGASKEILFDEEAAYQKNIGEDDQKLDGGFLEESDSDSDDDLL